LKKIISALYFFIFCYTTLFAQHPRPTFPLTRILFVFDCSQSMAGSWESDKKINIARRFLINTIDSLEKLDNVEMALRVYGHQSPVPPQDCNDTRLEVPFSPGNAPKIRQKLRYLIPKGTTPIAHSLELCIGDFPECENCRNVIILITDGIEACDGDPCAVSRDLLKNGIVLKPFVIGIGLDPQFRETFECVGHFYNAAEEKNFQNVLEIVITQALNSTTAQVNLLDIKGNPTETNVNMTFYDSNSGRIKHNFMHTINNRGNPDTLLLDPLIVYKMVIHTIPPVCVDSIKLSTGKHNIVAADTPQGYLNVVPSSGNQYRDLNFIIRKAGEKSTLNMQKVNQTEKYIVGKYDLEIPTLPRLLVDNIEIKQSFTTTVKIPTPGIVTIHLSSEGFCGLFVEKDTELEWIYNINPRDRYESLVLLPGKYRIIFRAKNAKRTIYTIEKSFVVESGKSFSVRLL
jgi:Ca-activated chloride channel family protein